MHGRPVRQVGARYRSSGADLPFGSLASRHRLVWEGMSRLAGLEHEGLDRAAAEARRRES